MEQVYQALITLDGWTLSLIHIFTAGKKLSGTESFPVYVQKNHTV